MKARSFPIVCLMLLAVQAKASIIDGVSVEYGTSASSHCDLKLGRIGVQKNWDRRWFQGDNWHVAGYWDLSLGYWQNDSTEKTNSGIVDIGFTPTFRLERNHPAQFSPYLEAAVGLHAFSHASVSAGRQFGSAFSFGDHIGIGVCFGPRNAYDLSYRLQHLSNGGIKAPNQGINYNLIRFGMHF